MIRLRTFGGALLEGPGGPITGAASQRRRLAVLSLLAAHDGISRDRIVAYLWPESPEEPARHALSQLLYAVRRELGGSAVTGSATVLRLDEDVVSSDVSDFRTALRHGELARAADLHGGPFLDGFHLPGCPGFERWVEEERARLAHSTERAIEKLARQAAAQGDSTGAVAWWRRQAALAPLDARVTLALMEALVADGDRAAAIRQARVHEMLARDELDSPADPRIVSFAATLAAHPPAPPDGPIHSLPEPPAPPAGSPPITGPPEPAVTAGAPEKTLTPAPPLRVVDGRRRSFRWGMAAAVAILIIAGGSWRAVASHGASSDDPERVLIAGVEDDGGEVPLGNAITVALGAGLGQSPRLQVVSPERIRETLERMRRPGADSLLDEALAREIARRDGIRWVVVPSLVRSAGRYDIAVRIIDPGSGAILTRATAHADRRDDVIAALDGLVRRARRGFGETALSVATRTVPLPKVTTPSLAALEKYASGARAFAAGRWEEADVLWNDAVRLDSAFAAAHAALGMLGYWTNRPANGEEHFARALAHMDALPERERMLIRARAASWRGDRESSTTLLRAYLIEHPNDLDALNALGYDYLRMNLRNEAGAIFHRILAVDSTDHSGWLNLAVVEKQSGFLDSALVHYRRAFALAPWRESENSNINLEFATTFVLRGDPDSAAAVFEKMLGGDRAVRARGLRSFAFLTMYRGHYTEATRYLEEAIGLNGALSQGISELRNQMLLATTLRQRGHADAARTHLDSAAAIGATLDVEPTLLYWLGRAFARDGNARRAAVLLEAMEARGATSSPTSRAAAEALRGELLVALGRANEGVPHLQRALRIDSSKFTLESLAHGLSESGALERASSAYEELASAPAFGVESQEYWRMARYWLGRIAERRSDDALAAQAYEAFLDGWRDAEPALPVIADARDRLVRLRKRQNQP